MSGQLGAPGITEQLAERLARPVDPATRRRARLHLLDWAGCVAGGLGERGPWRRAGTRLRLAAAGNVLEMDDVHRRAILHPGPVVWPAALAGARPLGAVLDAAVRGYEAAVGIGMSLDAHHYAHWHNTATAGVFGAAVAALPDAADTETIVSALGHAGSVAGGLWRMRHEASETKQFHLAHAAATGIAAAEAALAGFRGPRHILEGEQGFWAATCREPKPGHVAPDTPGWRIQEVSFKPHAACRHAHAAIDAALALRARGVPAEAIAVTTYADALRFCDRPEPRTPVEAKFSLQHAVAVAFVRGSAGLADFAEAAIADPAVAATRRAVSVREGAAFTAGYPAHFGAAVTAAGETELRADALGDPEVPLGADALAAKADALLAHGGMKARTRARLIARVLEDDEGADTPRWLLGKLARL